MRGRNRAVSEVLGYVLVFSLVVTTVGVVTVAGFGELQSARDVERVNNAERAFELLAANFEDLARREAPSRSTEIRLADARLSVTEPVNVSVRGVDDSDPSNNVSAAYEIQPIRYRSATTDTSLVYAAGAVFRTQSDTPRAGTVVESPDLVADGEVLATTLVQTRSRASRSASGGTVRVGADRAGVELPISDADSPFDRVYLNITSPRAALWAETLSAPEGLTCTLDTASADGRVWCETVDPRSAHVAIVRADVSVTH